MYKLAQLAIHDPSKSLKTGEILIQPAQEGGSGDLLILIEIDFNAPAAHQFIQHFLEIAYGAYEKFKIHEPEKILENILESLNVQLPELAPKNLNFFEKLHCFIGILAGNAVYFSTFGKIKTYLIKPALLKDINGSKIKCAFITVQTGFHSRYLLRTQILPHLKKFIEKIVIITRNPEEKDFL